MSTSNGAPSVRAKHWIVLLAVGALGLGVLAGCTSETPASTTSTSTRPPTSSTTPPAESEAEWLAKWESLVSQDYGRNQKAFLAAIQTRQATSVQAVAKALIDSNQRLTAALDAAGPPPPAEAKALRRLKRALTKEATLLQEVVEVCTAPTQACQDAVTGYAKNNVNEIIPALTDLGAQ